MREEFREKLGRIQALLESKKLEGMIITQQKNFSWLTSGRGHINMATEQSIAYLCVTLDSIIFITNNIESQRLIEEEIQTAIKDIRVYEWYQPSKKQACIDEIASQMRVVMDTSLEEELFGLRTEMSEDEMSRFERLGMETAEAIEETAYHLKRGSSEFEIAGQLANACMKRGIDPIVNLVGADERVFKSRNIIPTHTRLDKYAMLVVGGRRHGQICSATRLVHFGKPSEQLLVKQQAAASIDAALIAASKPGTTFTELMETLVHAYTEAGFPEEWKYLHQGGLTGYVSREKLLMPECDFRIKASQIFAWNPSISGVKSEDTIAIKSYGAKVLTQTGNFPALEIKIGNRTISRPALLIR